MDINIGCVWILNIEIIDKDKTYLLLEKYILVKCESDKNGLKDIIRKCSIFVVVKIRLSLKNFV